MNDEFLLCDWCCEPATEESPLMNFVVPFPPPDQASKVVRRHEDCHEEAQNEDCQHAPGDGDLGPRITLPHPIGGSR